MSILYPVDVENTRWTIYYLPTNSILHRNRVWPVTDGGPIEGQSSSIVYLLEIEENRPEYDPRLFILQGTETVDINNNEIRTTWVAIRRSNEERIEAAENEESYQLTRHVDIAREMVTTRLLLAAVLNNLINGENPPQKVRTLAQQHIDQTVKLYQNRDRLQAIIADINNGLDPDLDTGWAP